jgi:hypothetical protein
MAIYSFSRAESTTISCAPATGKVTPGTVLIQVGGGSALIVKTCILEVPPSGLGFDTVICPLPAVTRSLEGRDADSNEEDSHVVCSPDPFHRTVAPERKLDPATVKIVSGEPASASEGLIDVRDGTFSVDPPPLPPLPPLTAPEPLPHPLMTEVIRTQDMRKADRI